MDIQEVKSTQNRYNLISRQFEIAELKLLIDAVQSSKFISKERSEQMVSKIVTLAGQHKAEELKRNASVPERFHFPKFRHRCIRRRFRPVESEIGTCISHKYKENII